MSISGDVSVTGEVCLILADGCTLTANGSIQGGSLTIYGQESGTGKLTVTGDIISGNGGAGNDSDFNGGNGGSGGSIVINGGSVQAGNITSAMVGQAAIASEV